jgi:LacI family transcriptional regulator
MRARRFPHTLRYLADYLLHFVLRLSSRIFVTVTAGATGVITIRQLAKEVGLSATTVSMVLNSAPLASQILESTKKRVRLAAKKLGYRPNPFARSLFTNRSATVGILLSNITDPFSSEVLKGIDSSLHTSPYIPFLLNIQNSPEQLGRIQTLLDRRVEGIIGVATSLLFCR